MQDLKSLGPICLALAAAVACAQHSALDVADAGFEEPDSSTPADVEVDAGPALSPVAAIAFVEYGQIRVTLAREAELEAASVTDLRSGEELALREITEGPAEHSFLLTLATYQFPVAHSVQLLLDGMRYDFVLPASESKARVAFVSTAIGTGNLASWPGAVGDSPREMADSICQGEAEGSGLHGSFVAYLGDDSTDAACRIRNLSGLRSEDCGAATLLDDAGLVIGMDRRPVVAGGNAVDIGIWEGPIGFRLDGTSAENDYVRVMAGHRGGHYGPSCENWTSDSAQDRGSSSAAPGQMKPYGGYNVDCHEETPLYCVQVGGDFYQSFAPSKGQGMPAFVSSIAVPGHFNAEPGQSVAEAADLFCEARAAAAQIAGYRWSAWLSGAQDDALCRLLGGSGTVAEGCGGEASLAGAWMRTDGALVARSVEDLIDGRLDVFLNRDEFGDPWSAVYTYSGTRADGTAFKNNGCNPEGLHYYGTGGTIDALGSSWSQFWSGSSCAGEARVYCFAAGPAEL